MRCFLEDSVDNDQRLGDYQTPGQQNGAVQVHFDIDQFFTKQESHGENSREKGQFVDTGSEISHSDI